MSKKEEKIETPKQLMNFLNKHINYGFTYQDQVFLESEDFGKQMDKFWKLKTGNDLLDSGYGVCWDLSEFEREWFEKLKITSECFFFMAFLSRNEGGATHTFLLYEKDANWFWFEFSWEMHRGIWKYESKESALADIIEKFCQCYNKGCHQVEVYRTRKAKAGLNTFEFVEHCLSGEKIEINKSGEFHK